MTNEVAEQNNTTQNTDFATSIWSNGESFNVAARMAKALSESTVVPRAYQGNPGNCIIALDMANRLHTGPLLIMQNLYIVNGNPAWSSQYIIAMINNSKRYKTELQFEMSGEGESLACKAFAITFDDRRVDGPLITMDLAKKEGWIGKNGSKWKTMPEVMIRYRAASFFGRLNCPDLVMGMYSADEVREGATDNPRDITNSVSEVSKAKTIDDLLENKDEQKTIESGLSDTETKDELSPDELAKAVDNSGQKDPGNLFENQAN